jgi:Family of unknown function (DUF5678)
MEIKPNEAEQAFVDIVVESSQEDKHLDYELPGLFADAEIDGNFYTLHDRIGGNMYPYNTKIPVTSLGRVAGRAMVAGTEADLETARQILEYFEDQSAELPQSTDEDDYDSLPVGEKVKRQRLLAVELRDYKGKWVGVKGATVVASGTTLAEVLKEGKDKDVDSVFLVPERRQKLILSQVITRLV